MRGEVDPRKYERWFGNGRWWIDSRPGSKKSTLVHCYDLCELRFCPVGSVDWKINIPMGRLTVEIWDGQARHEHYFNMDEVEFKDVLSVEIFTVYPSSGSMSKKWSFPNPIHCGAGWLNAGEFEMVRQESHPRGRILSAKGDIIVGDIRYAWRVRDHKPVLSEKPTKAPVKFANYRDGGSFA